MITAIITAAVDGRRLEATLACLAPAAIDGLVREALVIDAGAGQAARDATEDAGARLIAASDAAGGLAAACAAARGAWLLVLPAGARLQSGWEAAARRHMERFGGRAGWFDLALEADGLAARLAEALAAIGAGAFGRLDARHGLLAPARTAGSVKTLSYADLARRAGRKRRLGVRALS